MGGATACTPTYVQNQRCTNSTTAIARSRRELTGALAHPLFAGLGRSESLVTRLRSVPTANNLSDTSSPSSSNNSLQDVFKAARNHPGFKAARSESLVTSLKAHFTRVKGCGGRV